MDLNDELLLTEHAAERLKCSVRKIRKLIKNGDLPARRRGVNQEEPYEILKSSCVAYMHQLHKNISVKADCQIIRDQIGRHTKYVFVRERKQNGVIDLVPMTVNANKAFNSAMKKSGIEGFHFHDLRHTWASWLIQAGVPLSALQEMGGWESIEVVLRYAHLAPDHLAEHAKKIDAVFNGCIPNTSHTVSIGSAARS